MYSNWRSPQDWRSQGLDLNTTSTDASKMFDAIVTQYTGWYDDENLGGMTGTLNKMLVADPDFVMGHVVRNGLELLGTGSNIRLCSRLQDDVSRMVKLSSMQPSLTQREQKHVAALVAWSNGEMKQASNVWEDILVDHPNDVLALKFAYDNYFYLGNSNQIRDCVARVLPMWKPTMHLYGYIVSMHSFGLEETNLYSEAENAARTALSINPKDGWATHTLCHVMEMMGRQHEGIYMLEKTGQYWQTCGMLACHNFWHWALYYIELGDYETALSLFDEEVTKRAISSGAMLDIVDICSLLYRLQLEGVSVEDRWEKVYDVCKSHLHDHILTFNDMHILISCLGAGQKQAVKEMMDSIEVFVRESKGTNRDITAEVGSQLFQAFIAYNDEDYSKVVDLINPVRSKIIKIGGSHAQRDLINQFLIQAAIKSNKKTHHNLARALLNERKLLKPSSPLTDRLTDKVMQILGD
uniref:Tetratricopeptide repeat protein 38 n=2 Tax=Biomphalaria glabrata TaxID=6526 RepID=A0A2C9JUD5_BIOGL